MDEGCKVTVRDIFVITYYVDNGISPKWLGQTPSRSGPLWLNSSSTTYPSPNLISVLLHSGRGPGQNYPVLSCGP